MKAKYYFVTKKPNGRHGRVMTGGSRTMIDLFPSVKQIDGFATNHEQWTFDKMTRIGAKGHNSEGILQLNRKNTPDETVYVAKVISLTLPQLPAELLEELQDYNPTTEQELLVQQFRNEVAMQKEVYTIGDEHNRLCPNVLDAWISKKRNRMYGVIIMEVVSAQTLLEITKQLLKVKDISLLGMVIDEVLTKVKVFHGNGFCHRDLHAQNILVDIRGHNEILPDITVKIIDFGATKKLETHDTTIRYDDQVHDMNILLYSFNKNGIRIENDEIKSYIYDYHKSLYEQFVNKNLEILKQVYSLPPAPTPAAYIPINAEQLQNYGDVKELEKESLWHQFYNGVTASSRSTNKIQTRQDFLRAVYDNEPLVEYKFPFPNLKRLTLSASAQGGGSKGYKVRGTPKKTKTIRKKNSKA
jgi:tRNA A-37 threonylcarbamoyl transferase component Bud32